MRDGWEPLTRFSSKRKGLNLMASKWLYWFEELGSKHNDMVGKKCANLGEMTRLGMRVPPGFADLR